MSPDRIQDARRSFFSAGTLAQNLVSQPIQRSWSRCAALGLEVGSRSLPEPLTPQEFAAAAEEAESFKRLCRPELEVLYADAEANDSIVILTNAQGLILDTVGSTDFAQRAARVALRPGVPWTEQIVGTNAIGTALAEGCPIEVRGAEHYLECNRILSCSATPIIGPQGKILGVLDLSGPAEVHQAHALGLVRLAAEQIEHRLFDRGFEHTDLVRLQADPSLLGTPREGILVFENGQLKAANRQGLLLVGRDYGAVGTAAWADLFQDGLSAFSDTGRLRRIGGSSLFGRLDRPRKKVSAISSPQQKPVTPRAIQPIFDLETLKAVGRAVRLLDADVPVLVWGETGTGKEIFARAAHERCARSGKPFVAINCAALPETLMEAELFGYQPGAFTGARAGGSKGHLREADGGVLFLDEIGDMPLALQTKLLRVLQEREVVPLGGGRPAAVDFALICATNRDLAELVRTGGFRSDLYYRIAQYTIELQPLSRRGDRDQLIDALWEALGGRARRITLSPDCLAHLTAYHWPGNFRQLVGCLRAMLALCEPGETAGTEALPSDIRANPAECGPGRTRSAEQPASLDALTINAMQDALQAAGGNVSLAARRLGVSRSTLYRRLHGQL
ncbi:sigma-54-dependent Fis family transcriptional regulator [Microvirga subterranea]|uniref:Transcriptional regulator of acetoin/glycerol metabolism n=1 Tax=Microvirga subterranea TaxID=186651 RepID=A0A370HRW9_9HYPH|nr:sigma-54-dependent Fis family transcriptional regulator [Microvirga subterranea]RDI61267.1 transcriptional regulator of acetoin/glycerol metabolism [Microvirga subterranea]